MSLKPPLISPFPSSIPVYDMANDAHVYYESLCSAHIMYNKHAYK